MLDEEVQHTINDAVQPGLVTRQRRSEVGDRTTEYCADDRQDQHDHDDDDQRRNDTWHALFLLHPQHWPHSYQCKKRCDEKRDEQHLGHLHAVDDNDDCRQADN